MKINGLLRLSLLPAVVFFTIGCGNANRKGHTVNDYRKIYGNVLTLPQGGRWMTCDGRDTLVTPPDGIPRIVIYYGAEGCAPCRLLNVVISAVARNCPEYKFYIHLRC